MSEQTEMPIEVDVATVNEMQQKEEAFLLLDVREQNEYDIAKIEGSVLLPMSELRLRLEELEPHQDSRIVVHCHHGGRSMQVTRGLRERGYAKAQNMSGGIDAWSLQVDSSVARY
ncbi:MAG TPA: rhodanese [Rhodopirellula sp.]|nr:MAG: rhodanese [Saprospirales bacterium TMED214]HBV65625.1 rhodanese [Rhodopirellula sp.]